MVVKRSISKVKALEILDSRGNPTVSTQVILSDGSVGEASVPSGASTGTHEALELRDGNPKRFRGLGVLKAISNVNKKIFPAVKGKNALDQAAVDRLMIKLDGTKHKKQLGANAILSVSMATAKAAANSLNLPLYRYLRQTYWSNKKKWLLPIPMLNLLNGGKHAPGSVDLQEFMIFPVGSKKFSTALRWSAEIYHTLKSYLYSKGLSIGIGDEGGFMPKLNSHEQALKLLITAIKKAGYKPKKHVALALDPAATEIYENGLYHLKTEGRKLTSKQMIDMYARWAKNYPIVSIEDGLAEDDWDGFTLMTKTLGDKIQIVGDDLFATSLERLETGIDKQAANSILIKLNQIGTVTETVQAIDSANQAGMTSVISHRSGETADTFFVDLTVASNAGQIKTGAPARSDRTSKYNRLLRIEHELGSKARYATWTK